MTSDSIRPSEQRLSAAPLSSTPLGNDLPATAPFEPNTLKERCNWLSFHHIWGVLPEASLEVIAASLQLLTVEPGTDIYYQEQAAIGLYLLKWGSVGIYRQSPVGRTHICYRSAGDLFGYVPLVTATASTTYQASAIALTTSEIWFLRRGDLERLMLKDPDIQTPINRLLAQDVTQFAQRIAWEQVRTQGLQCYLRPIAGDPPLTGRSKAGHKLAQQVETAVTTLDASCFRLVREQAKRFGRVTFIASRV
jgi:CRP-like cAMP-binding protein